VDGVEESGLPGGALFAVVDVETSGLSARRHRILQVAVVAVAADGTIVDRWSSYVRPRWGRVGPSHIHGLSARDLRRSPRFETIAPELAHRLDGAIVVAHNASFDWAFISRALRRAGVGHPDANRLCTMRLSRSLDPERQLSHRLADVTERYGVSLEHAHDARADAEATALVLPHLLRAAGVDPADAEAMRPHLRGASTTWAGLPAPRRWWPTRRGNRSAGAPGTAIAQP
jgi:DNA polymerase-3 subunit epsilon